jgi:hypothetical protein
MKLVAALTLGGIVLGASSSLGIITIGPRQLISSTESLAGGRAQYVGRFGSFIGTPISPRHFATATHIGNAGGGIFYYKNGTGTESIYLVHLRATQDDLAIWELNADQSSFTLWSPVYATGDELGRAVTLLGRGTDKGAEVRYPETTGALRGYRWGASDGLISWGTNNVADFFAFEGVPPPGLGGDYLYMTFDQSGGATEGNYSVGDSGGPVFITDTDSVVKLAGINSLVDGDYSYTSSGPFFSAALWDTRGFYVGAAGNSVRIEPTLPDPVPSAGYATRISSRMAFISAIIDPVLPPTCGTSDFNGDGDFGTDQDIEAFFTCLAGNCCATCWRGGADFNGDGDVGTDQDIEAFFRVLAGGAC